MQRKFTLIELITVIVVISIIAAIIIINISGLKERGLATANLVADREVQGAVDRYHLLFDKYPTLVQPTINSSEKLLMEEELYPEFLKKNLPKNIYCVDYNGAVFRSLSEECISEDNDGDIEEDKTVDLPKEVDKLDCSAAESQGYICIYTVSDLKDINNNLTGRYILMNDIDLVEVDLWDPIGNSEYSEMPFGGELNGNGYTIKNLVNLYDLEGPYQYEIGLFGHVDNAVFKNLMIENFDIQVKLSENRDYSYAIGSLIGLGYSATLENVAVNGFHFDRLFPESMSLKEAHTEFIGGLIGLVEEVTIKDVVVRKIDITGTDFLGGLAGLLGESNIENIYVDGVLIGHSEEDLKHFNSEAIGGLSGELGVIDINNVTIKNTKLMGTESIGGLAGSMTGIAGDNAQGEFIVKNINVEANIKGMEILGGLAGVIGSDFTFVNAHTFVNIESMYESNYYKDVSDFGGLIGYSNNNLKVENASTIGIIKGMNAVGGFVGNLNGMSTFDNIHSSIDIYESQVADKSENIYDNVAGLIGDTDLDGMYYLTIKNSSYTGTIFDLIENSEQEYNYSPLANATLEDIDFITAENVYWNSTKNPSLTSLIGEGKEDNFFKK